ncbi:hypothetical protein OROHE_018978 [Orobanche hederae]
MPLAPAVDCRLPLLPPSNAPPLLAPVAASVRWKILHQIS